MLTTLCSRAKIVGAEPNVSRARLDNGLQVIVVRSQLAPVVTTIMNYLVGSNEAPDGFPGTAHAQEHMMFRGSPDISADQLADISASIEGKALTEPSSEPGTHCSGRSTLQAFAPSARLKAITR